MKMKKFFREFSKKGLLFFSLLSILLLATNVSAYTFNLINPNWELAALGSGPYATVSVSLLDSDTAQINVEAISPYMLTNSKILDLNVSTDYTVNTISDVRVVQDMDAKFADPMNVDDQGYFNLVFNTLPAAGQLASFYVIIDAIGGSSWADEYSVLTKNGDGNLAAAHIWTTSGETGFAGSVPLPGAVWLLGSGLIGIATIRRRAV